MKILGLQKLTLLDYPGKTACTVFTAGCNLRCPFCHNAMLVTDIDESQEIEKDDVLKFLKSRRGLLDGVCITGGEPLLQRDISDFVKAIKELGFLVKLDTNGTFPDKLQELISQNLVDYVAMDIKNCKEKYAETTGIIDFDVSPIEKSIEILKNSTISYEFRTTVVKEFHAEEDIIKIGQWIGDSDYYLQNFVDSGNLICSGLNSVSEEELHKMLNFVEPFVKNAQIRGI